MATCTATQSQSSYKYNVKVMLIGNSRVGKSSIALQFADSKYVQSFKTTNGVDFRTRDLEVDGDIVKICLWDTAGQERFRTITMVYYRNAKAVLLVWDITEKVSFENTRHWPKDIQEKASGEIVLILVGNKTDKESARVVSYDEGATLAQDIGCSFFETSAKTGSNIMHMFKFMAKLYKDKLVAGGGNGVVYDGELFLDIQHSQQKNTCCGCVGGRRVDRKYITLISSA